MHHLSNKKKSIFFNIKVVVFFIFININLIKANLKQCDTTITCLILYNNKIILPQHVVRLLCIIENNNLPDTLFCSYNLGQIKINPPHGISGCNEVFKKLSSAKLLLEFSNKDTNYRNELFVFWGGGLLQKKLKYLIINIKKRKNIKKSFSVEITSENIGQITYY